MLNLNEDSDA